MKIYRHSVIKRLKMAGSETGPAPFPGRYPTRLCIKWVNGTMYIGKPFAFTRELWKKVLTLREFDREHLVAAVKLRPDGLGPNKVAFTNTPFKAYHPEFLMNGGLNNLKSLQGTNAWFNTGFFTIRWAKQAPPFYTAKCNAEEPARNYYIASLQELLKVKKEPVKAEPVVSGLRARKTLSAEERLKRLRASKYGYAYKGGF